jgi:hypothetical protein
MMVIWLDGLIAGVLHFVIPSNNQPSQQSNNVTIKQSDYA